MARLVVDASSDKTALHSKRQDFQMMHPNPDSEQELQAKLDYSGVASGSELSKGARPDDITYGVEVGVINNVEDFTPELDSSLFREPEGLQRREVEIVQPRTDNVVAACIAEGKRCGGYKGIRIEPMISSAG